MVDHDYVRPEAWSDPTNKLFPHQVGLTSPPAPSGSTGG